MKISRMVVACAVGLSLGASVGAADTQPAAVPATRPARGPAAPAGLGAAMKDMAKMYTTLKTEAADPDKTEQALRDVAMMERDAAIAKVFLPPMVRRETGDEKVTKTEDYRVAMVGLMKTLLKLEDGIAAKKPDDVKQSLDAIEQVMNKGHKEFIPKQN